MGKEARGKEARKATLLEIPFTENERFQMLIWWNNAVNAKGHSERRQLDRFFDAVDMDDFPLDEPVSVKKLNKEDQIGFQLDGGMVDYMIEQMKKDSPQGIGIYCQRTIGILCQRLQDAQEKATEQPKLESVQASE